MKILMVSVFSNHFINWASQLHNSTHDIYWLDISDSNSYIKRLDFITQIVNWKRRLDFPGRQWIKLNSPALYKKIEKLNNRSFEKQFIKQLGLIKPDLVQSFELHSACVPILEIMNKRPDIKWVYSSMGNDIFYFQAFPKELRKIKKVLMRIDYMFADCKREYDLARQYGWKGEFLGVFPTGGGYDLKFCESLIETNKRNSIIVKGYQSKFGRCIPVLQALSLISDDIKNYKIIVFSGIAIVENYIKESGLNEIMDIEFNGRVGRVEVLKIMGRSSIYIGNSISDGLPNTLLEAIIMGAFPIQSNPGGATEEIIVNNQNGLLINEPENPRQIADLIKKAISDSDFLNSAVEYNTKNIRPQLDYKRIAKNVLEKYNQIESKIKLL